MNFCYFAGGFNQVVPLNILEGGTLDKFIVIYCSPSDLEYRCRGTGKCGNDGFELFEGTIVEDPGWAIGVVVWNTSHSQFLVLFDGETAEVDDSVSEWAKIVGHILIDDDKFKLNKEQYSSCMDEIYTFEQGRSK